jgi:methyl-accepting chemotaxis protein
MRIRTKIFALVGGLGLVAGLIAGVAIDTVRTYDATVRAVDEGATRAHHSEHLNRLVTAVVMESRGIYAARDSQDAKRFAQGLTTYLDEIDALLAVWQPLVPESDRALFNAVKASAAEFRAFRTETARLGLEVGPKAANEQGNNDANRANRKAFQDSIDALTKHSREGVEALRAGTQSLYDGRLALLVGLAFGGGVGAIALAALLGQRQIAGPLHQVTAALQKLAAGDRTLPEVQLKQDEIGDIWRTMRVFADAMAETERLRAESLAADEAVAQRRRREMEALAQTFEATVGDVLRQVQASAEEMRVATGVVNNSAEEVTGQSAAVGRSAERAAAGVGSAAAAAEELTASIDEIASHMEQSAAASRQAVDETKVTNGVVRQLSEAAQKVGDIVNLISDIAAQTNLLALNATIEAARAGEAGKGFAVVAQEVKSLATQTARATGDISAQIAAIQNSTGATVDAIGRIGGRIEEMNAISTSIASAVEEQSAATKEIARSVLEASQYAQSVDNDVTAINRCAQEAGSAVAQLSGAIANLDRQMGVVRTQVDAFLQKVRAA